VGLHNTLLQIVVPEIFLIFRKFERLAVGQQKWYLFFVWVLYIAEFV
jgi:hypothetical protein